MQFLKADTNVEVLIGPAVAVGDGFTPVTTLSLSTADEAEIIKHGGATALTVTSISANTMSAITGADGYYTLDLTTGNLDTEGPLTILINDDSLILPIRQDYMVVSANVYDSLFAASGTDTLDVQTTGIAANAITATSIASNAITSAKIAASAIGATQIASNAITAAKIATDAITAAKIAADAIGASELAADAVAEIADGVWDEVITAAEHNVNTSAAKFLREASASVAGLTGTAQSGTANTITLESGAVTANDILNGERITIIDGTGVGQSRLISDSVITTDVVTVSSNWVTNPDSTSVYSIVGAEVDVRAIEGDITASDNLLADYDGTGYAKANSTIGTCTTNTDMRGTDSAATATALATAQADLDTLTGADGVTLASAQGNQITYAQGVIINNSNANEPALSLTGNGTGAGLLSTGGTSGDGIEAVGGSTDGHGLYARASTSARGAYFHNTGTGEGFRAQAVNNSHGARIIGQGTGHGLFVEGGATGNDIDGNLSGSVGSNLELGPAEVNAEVLDVLNTDTFAEPGTGAPGATISLAAKIGYLYKAWRNRSTQTATTYSLYADDATTVDQKATVSDDGTTADKGEVATGP